MWVAVLLALVSISVRVRARVQCLSYLVELY